MALIWKKIRCQQISTSTMAAALTRNDAEDSLTLL